MVFDLQMDLADFLSNLSVRWGVKRLVRPRIAIRHISGAFVVLLTYLQSQARSTRHHNEELDESWFLKLFFVRDITSLLNFYILSSFG